MTDLLQEITVTEPTYETLLQSDVEAVLNFIPIEVHAQLLAYNVVLAGGTIRSMVAGDAVSDIDIFCHDEEQARALATAINPRPKRSRCSYTVVLDGHKIQYIFYKTFDTAYDLIDEFDFRACCAAIYNDSETGWTGIAISGFYEDCQSKQLIFRKRDKDKLTLTPLRRALNFATKGWRIDDEEVADIIVHFEPSVCWTRARASQRAGYGGRG